MFILGRIQGVSRPAILTVIPTLKGDSVLIDAGANATCKIQNLIEFAKIGKIFARNKMFLANFGSFLKVMAETFFRVFKRISRNTFHFGPAGAGPKREKSFCSLIKHPFPSLYFYSHKIKE